jgi:hypothetical protein
MTFGFSPLGVFVFPAVGSCPAASCHVAAPPLNALAPFCVNSTSAASTHAENKHTIVR